MKKNIKMALATGAIIAMLINPLSSLAQTHQVRSGDTYFKISQQYGVDLNELLRTNNAVTNHNLIVGQNVVIPQKGSSTITYTVVRGDNLWTIAKNHNASLSEVYRLNNLNERSVLQVGQRILIPVSGQAAALAPAPTAPVLQQNITYTVVRGDTLSHIALRHNTTVSAIRTLNKLSSDTIFVGQKLQIPSSTASRSGSNIIAASQPSVTYKNYTVKSGDNLWSIGVNQGVPMAELLKLNGLTNNSVLRVGQVIRIPVYNIPVKPVVSARHGELLDWWTEAQYVFPIGSTAKVIDLDTGRSFNVKRSYGANHADCEPLTAQDAKIMHEIWGNQWSWNARAVVVEVNGRRIAASSNAMPHDIQSITNNNFNGHFCIHFLNSTRHRDGLLDQRHQPMVRKAAGVQ
jgi:LysM repeat protein